jgi:hypothetical protein
MNGFQKEAARVRAFVMQQADKTQEPKK